MTIPTGSKEEMEGGPELPCGAKIAATEGGSPVEGLDPEMASFLAGVVGVVEANSFEQHMLWDENSRRREPKTWGPINPGLLEIVGHLAGMPVCISLFKARVGGHLLLFIHPTSQVVDHRLIDAWLDKAMPESARRPDGRVNEVDAMNFHNVFPRAPLPLPPRDPLNASLKSREAPTLPSREELERALREIGRRARSDGQGTFDDAIRNLGWIDDECRRLSALAQGADHG